MVSSLPGMLATQAIKYHEQQQRTCCTGQHDRCIFKTARDRKGQTCNKEQPKEQQSACLELFMLRFQLQQGQI